MAKKDLNITNSLATPKEFGAHNLFNYKKKYKNVDSVVVAGPNVIDFQDIRQMYGKLDLQGRAIHPSEENFITLSSEKATQPIFIMNFVGRAFLEFKGYMRRAALRKRANSTSPIFELSAVAGWESYKQEYHNHLNQIYLLFFNRYIRRNKINEKIENFDDFVEAFLPFMRNFTSQFGMPFTFSGFIKSQLCSPMISGLMIDIYTADCNDDVIKRTKFLQDPDFEFFRNSAKKFGFVVDKNIPWRLVADLSSNGMKKHMDNLGLGYRDVFPEYYHRSINDDVAFLKEYMRGFYNSLVESIPYVNQTQYCAKKIKTISKLKKRLPISKELMEKNYPMSYWFSKYLTFRAVETKSSLTDLQIKMAEKKITRMSRKFDISTIMLYIDNLIENNTGVKKHMFKQESWPDFVYTPEPKPELDGFESETWKENNSVDKDSTPAWLTMAKAMMMNPTNMPLIFPFELESQDTENNTATSGLKKVAPTEYLSDDGSDGPCE